MNELISSGAKLICTRVLGFELCQNFGVCVVPEFWDLQFVPEFGILLQSCACNLKRI